MPAFIIFLLFLATSSRAIKLPSQDDEFLKIKCGQRPLFATLSPICRAFLAQKSRPTDPQNLTVTMTTQSSNNATQNSTALVFTPDMMPQNSSATPTLPILIEKTATIAVWAKALLGILSSIITIYSALVSYFRFKLHMGNRSALSLGICHGPNSRDSADIANDLPIPLNAARVEPFNRA